MREVNDIFEALTLPQHAAKDCQLMKVAMSCATSIVIFLETFVESCYFCEKHYYGVRRTRVTLRKNIFDVVSQEAKNMDLGLNGKHALVTGGERGIGRDLCLSLAQEGVDIAYCDIKIENGKESTQQEIRKLGRKAFAMEIDVSDEKQVIDFVQTAIKEFGSIDIFVSNAGIIEWEPITKITLECWNRILGVNLTGAMLCTREIARHMVEKRKGVILFTSSTIQFNPAYKEAAYRVSKTGVQVFAETAAIELAPYGIRVNTVSPGLINSPNWAKGVLPKAANDPQTGEGFMSNIPLGRLGLPNDVGSAYAFLASDKASFATGANIVLDGGFTMRPLVLVSQDEIRNMNLRG